VFNLPRHSAGKGKIMSAPQTNIDRQKRRHRGPLIGILAGLAFVAILFFFYLGDTATPDESLLNEPTAPVTSQPVAPAGN
jgi:molybdopterin-guanine dinucleotide biosynthesis protein A